MTQIERLNKIANKGAEMIANANAEQNRKEQIVVKYEQDIKALAPRIKELMDIAIALCNNNLPLGKRTKALIGYDEEFVTNGITHKLGFYFNNDRNGKYLVGIGIRGGGCCGHNLAVDEYGCMIQNPIKTIVGCWTYDRAHWDYCDKCKTFLNGFDEFERRVNEYVDNL